jgi:hypothetical protein
VICTHALTAFCECVPRRPSVYTAPHVAMRPSGERLAPWRCQCTRPDGRPLLRKYRHESEIDCVSVKTVQAFKTKHTIQSDELAKALLFIESFAP